jgi:transcriptional regulator with XRE-family HTH domain
MGVPRHDWYLKQWLRDKQVSQQWLADQLGVQKSMISRKATGVTPYDRDDINAVSAVLRLDPYELLMHPDDAHQIKRLRVALEEEHRLRVVSTTVVPQWPDQNEPEPGRRVADRPIGFIG